MTQIDDEALRDQLRRRVASGSLTEDARDQILGAVAAERTASHSTGALAANLGRWVGVAAAALSLILVAAVVLKPPVGQAPPASSLHPGSAAASPPSASVSPTSGAPSTQPASEPHVFSAQELSDMIGGDRVGDVVLGEARLVQNTVEPKVCPPPEPCREAALLAEVSGRNVVAVGWRTAPEGTGTRVEDEKGVRWLTRLGVPTQSGLFAFSILTDAVEFLGPVVKTLDRQIAWAVVDVQAGDGEHPSNLYVVEGWLVQTPPVSCPAPNDYGPDTSMAYWCGGSFITQTRVATYSSERGVLLDPGGLHVQWDAYDEFAESPLDDGLRGAEPRFGTYLVRSAGCHPVTAGDCPVWSMLGRIDNHTPPVALGNFPSEINAELVVTRDAVAAHIASAVDDSPFLIGGEVKYVSSDCFVPDDFPTTALLVPCDDNYVFGYGPGGFHLVLSGGNLSGFQIGPAVLRVHVHDQRAADCPVVYRDRCEAAVVVEQVAWSASEATPQPAPSDAVTDVPTLAVGNWTTLRVFVYVNGMDTWVLEPGETIEPITPGMLRALPWHVEATTSTGRVLLTLTVNETDVWHSDTDPPGGSTAHGVAARVELSCGRIDIWAGPPLSGPAPPASFPPGDCEP